MSSTCTGVDHAATPSPAVTVLCHSRSVVGGLPAVSGCVKVHLDDGRSLRCQQADLLAAVTDLAQRRSVMDELSGLLLDPLPSPTDSDIIILQIRREPAGEEIGTRHTTSAQLDTALNKAWT
jgi:hypothetical protein